MDDHAAQTPVLPLEYTDLETLTLSPAVALGYPLRDPRAMIAEIESLRVEVATLRRALADLRTLGLAGAASRLGQAVLASIIDVLCALLQPQRGQVIVGSVVERTVRRDSQDSQVGIGPLQMTLERPLLEQALATHPTHGSSRYESVLWLPIQHNEESGVILCFRRSSTNPFTDRDQQRGAILAPLLISALQTGRKLFDLSSDEEALRVLEQAIRSRLPLAGAQVAAIARDAERVAACLGLDSDERAAIEFAAILHDIGTVDLADELLHKDGPLSADELAQVREHPTFGVAIARQIAGTEAVLPLILHHHEHWDGSGYPSGLWRDAIPLGARIISVVEAFHTATTPTGGRKPCTTLEALMMLGAGAGRRYDPRVVARFVALCQEDSRNSEAL